VNEKTEGETRPVKNPPGKPELRYLAQGEDVAKLQKILNEKGFAVEETGVYDMQTVKAVRAAQVAAGMPQTGSVQEDTWRMLAKTTKKLKQQEVTENA